ncbi:MAG TPA: hypothetical protein VGQ83_25050 [Polyangia bacterium]
MLSRTYSRRLVVIIGVALAVGLTARWAAKPKGFGRAGHYRGDAPAEEAVRAPRHQGQQVCAPCHDAEFQKHEKDVHLSVECEDCHGAGDVHVAARRAKAPAAEGRMFRQLAQANCLACHRRLVARPALFPTVDVGAHFKLVGVRDPATTCQSCHSPHEPLFLDRKVSQARIHPLIHPCTDCHRDASVAQRPRPEGHVVTFQCRDCHADVVADFATKPHKALDCRACHPFRKDSEFSGRIFKNASPQFCLMCHRDAAFKERGRMPLIKSLEEHRKDMGGDDAKRCVDCHLTEKIHAARAGAAKVIVGGGK